MPEHLEPPQNGAAYYDYGPRLVQKLDTLERACGYCGKSTKQDLLYLCFWGSDPRYYANPSVFIKFTYQSVGRSPPPIYHFRPYVYQCQICGYCSVVNDVDVKTLRQKYGDTSFSGWFWGSFYKQPKEQRRIIRLFSPKEAEYYNLGSKSKISRGMTLGQRIYLGIALVLIILLLALFVIAKLM
jgi:hypothetical protein